VFQYLSASIRYVHINADVVCSAQQGRQPVKKGCGSMKFSPKEARSLADPQEAKEYRRLINKEMEDMTSKELQRLYWNILRKKG
jgi:hypothetical protein